VSRYSPLQLRWVLFLGLLVAVVAVLWFWFPAHPPPYHVQLHRHWPAYLRR
jgi:hypothetical protein